MTQSVAEAIKADAIARYPHEACGLVVDGTYVPQANKAATPETNFEIDPQVWVTYRGRIEAVVHSHTDAEAWMLEHNGRYRRPPGFSPFCPTAEDMRGQRDTAVTWGITVTDGTRASEPFWWDESLLDHALVGRSFIHGVYDCYSLIRAWYWQRRGVVLPDFPRSDGWWSAGQDLYRDNFAVAGFRELRPGETRDVGDVFLANIMTDRPNHGGVYTGNGLGLHHLMGRLSRHEPVTRYEQAGFITHWLRYDP
jgi:cell wall-associated NlpC family hydrolase